MGRPRMSGQYLMVSIITRRVGGGRLASGAVAVADGQGQGRLEW